MKLNRLSNLRQILGALASRPHRATSSLEPRLKSDRSDHNAFHEGGRDARAPSKSWFSEIARKALAYRPAVVELLLLVGAVAACLILFSSEVWARVGGGQSYGGRGGSGGGSSDGGAIVGVVRVLLWLTIEYPAVGIPVDIAVVGFVVYRFARAGSKKAEQFSSTRTETSAEAAAFPLGLDTAAAQSDFSREFAQLRKFDPNFSEIVFTDFCYALYAKAHDARGHGANALDQFSPYIGEAARKSLLQRNPAGLREVKGIIVGGLKVEDVRGLETPTVTINLVFETNYTEVVSPNGSGATGKTNEMTYYVRERWQLERKRDVLSPPPAQATAPAPM